MTTLSNRKHNKNKTAKKNIINEVTINNSNTISKVEIKDDIGDTYTFNDFLEESDTEDSGIKKTFNNKFYSKKKSTKYGNKNDANLNEAYIKQIKESDNGLDQYSNDSIRNKIFLLPNIKVKQNFNSNDFVTNQFSIFGAIIRFIEGYMKKLKSFDLFIIWLALIYINSLLSFPVRIEWILMEIYSYYYYIHLFESKMRNFFFLKFFQIGINVLLVRTLYDKGNLIYTLGNAVIYILMVACSSGFDLVIILVILSLLVIHNRITTEITKEGFYIAIEIILFALFFIIHKFFIIIFEYKIEYTSLINQNRNEVLKTSQCQSFGFIIDDNTKNSNKNNNNSNNNLNAISTNSLLSNEKVITISQYIKKKNENYFGDNGPTIFFNSTLFEHISPFSLIKLLYYKYQEQRHFINSSPAISRFRKHLASNASFLNSPFNPQNRNSNKSKSNNKQSSNLTSDGHLRKYATCECQTLEDKQDRFYISVSTIMDTHALVNWILPEYINNNLRTMVNNTKQYIIQHSSSFINPSQNVIDNISYQNRIDTSTLLPIPQLIMEYSSNNLSFSSSSNELFNGSNNNNNNNNNGNSNNNIRSSNNSNNNLVNSQKNNQVILQKKDFEIKVNDKLWDSYAMFITNDGIFVSIIYGLEPNTAYRIKVSLNQHWSSPVDIYTKERINVNIPNSSGQSELLDNNNHDESNSTSLIATLEHKKNLYHHLQSNLVELTEERKNNQMALKKLKKETAKALSQLKSEIEYTKRFILKDKQNNMKTVKRIQFIKEYIKQTEQSLDELEQMGTTISDNCETVVKEYGDQLEKLMKEKSNYSKEIEVKRKKMSMRKMEIEEYKKDLEVIKQVNLNIENVELEKIKKLVNQLKYNDIPRLDQDIQNFKKSNDNIDDFGKNVVDEHENHIQDRLEKISEFKNDILELESQNNVLMVTISQEQKFKEELKDELKNYNKK